MTLRLIMLVALLTSCATKPKTWRYEEAMPKEKLQWKLTKDMAACKSEAIGDNGGNYVRSFHTQKMHYCMLGKGWMRNE